MAEIEFVDELPGSPVTRATKWGEYGKAATANPGRWLKALTVPVAEGDTVNKTVSKHKPKFKGVAEDFGLEVDAREDAGQVTFYLRKPAKGGKS